ncbi:MAG: hypothetical protein ACI4P4_13090, partial [Faecousia sp.]
MKARQREAIMRHAMRMFICAVVCLFALSTMLVTAHAEDGEGSTSPGTNVALDASSGNSEDTGNTSGNSEDAGNTSGNSEDAGNTSGNS